MITTAIQMVILLVVFEEHNYPTLTE